MTSAETGDQCFGPRLQLGSARFQLWAPRAKAAAVLIEGQPAVPMSLDGQGFWSVQTAAGAGALYRFEVDRQQVPDPASRFQPEDVGGPSQVVDAAAYGWKHPDWRGRPWEETVLYEAHAGLLGGYDGLRRRLADLAALGVTAIELMPIGEFAGARNWGYDGVMPFAPDSAYGEPDALRALIDEAHGLGLMVFLDVVYNHFGPDGNWLPAYAPTFFDEASKTPWGAAIDFHKAAVRRFFTENALYWLGEFRFDGLRLDAVHMILDRSWLVEMAGEVRGAFPDRHVHLVLENENNDAGLLREGFDAQWNDDFHNVLHVLLTGESHAYYRDFADHPAQRLARCLAQGFIYQGDPSANHDGRPRGQPSGTLPSTAFVSFLQNHDQVGNRAFGERLTQLADPRALRAAMALLLLCPQIPMLFMGEEVGAREPFLFFTDFHGELAAAVREGRRGEFDGAPGFSDAQQRDAIPDPNAQSTYDASRWTDGAPDAADWRAFIAEHLAVRRDRLVPRLKGVRGLGAEALGEKAVMARWRLADGATLTLAVNLAEESVAADLPDTAPLIGAPAGAGSLAGFTTLAWIQP
jgi:maltooligosyltrehalose trehalohydrolase